MRILVVDDEPAVRDAVDRALRLDGYDVALAADGRAALDALAAAPPDAVVLDVLMPCVDGLEVCRRLRAAGDRTPVLMLTARDAIADRVRGLDAGRRRLPRQAVRARGAARAACGRCCAGRARTGRPAPCCGSPTSSSIPSACTVHRGGRPIELTRTEFLLLELFLRHPRQVLTRTIIFDRVWGYDFGPASNSLEVYVGYLRRKTEAGGEPRLMHTVRGVGYVLREP